MPEYLVPSLLFLVARIDSESLVPCLAIFLHVMLLQALYFWNCCLKFILLSSILSLVGHLLFFKMMSDLVAHNTILQDWKSLHRERYHVLCSKDTSFHFHLLSRFGPEPTMPRVEYFMQTTQTEEFNMAQCLILTRLRPRKILNGRLRIQKVRQNLKMIFRPII